MTNAKETQEKVVGERFLKHKQTHGQKEQNLIQFHFMTVMAPLQRLPIHAHLDYNKTKIARLQKHQQWLYSKSSTVCINFTNTMNVKSKICKKLNYFDRTPCSTV